MILVSGFNVYPNDVEKAIAENPKVLEVGVRGEKNEDGTEFVRAFIVKKDDSLTEEEVIEFCRTKLTNYKVPKTDSQSYFNSYTFFKWCIFYTLISLKGITSLLTNLIPT